MLAGISGPLLSHHFLQHGLARALPGSLGESTRAEAHRRLLAWRRDCGRTLGPASAIRAIVDRAASPLAVLLGFGWSGGGRAPCPNALAYRLDTRRGRPVALIVAPWGDSLDVYWRPAVRHGLALDADWCLCLNGPQIRIVDTRRTYARRFVEIDFLAAIDDDASFAAAWSLLRADAFDRPAHPGPGDDSPVDRIVALSDQHARGVCASLQEGVLDALEGLSSGLLASMSARRRRAQVDLAEAVLEQSLTIVYRVLFLLFAEARRLVPVWHPVYRESYTIESIRALVERSTPARGIWDAVCAISRLAHEGCRAGDLDVTAFNGRLFAPRHAPLGDRASIDDGTMGRALRALTSREIRGRGRERIAYDDLGVEQLGAVYEQVLDYALDVPAGAAGPAVLTRRRDGRSRKSTGTFYTPRSLTDFLVRRTLHPLVADATPDAILTLKVLDPAMGSGAFLVAACRYLASAYEHACVREGVHTAGDVTDADRAGFRRLIAQRCLFGVDANPMAVQLARLSVWLTTLAAGKPLGFCDHRLRAGDSLVGASLDDLARRGPPCGSRRAAAAPSLPLFDAGTLTTALRGVVPERHRLASVPDEKAATVREKERTLADLTRTGTALARWRAVADLWCACWFWEGAVPPPDPALFAALVECLQHGSGPLPPSRSRQWLDLASSIAARRGFFHWTLEFPEVFFDAEGRPLPDGGFDAILGNPPWDVIRADGDARDRRGDAAALLRFARESGVYAHQGEGHPNLYQLFADRSLGLLRRGGRLGLVAPSGLATDAGSSRLRRALLDRTRVDTLIGFTNRDGIFPVHRSVRFLLVAATSGERTGSIPCRFGERDASVLDRMPDDPSRPDPAVPVVLTPALVERVSGPALLIPELATPMDLRIVERIAASWPALGAADGWHAQFGRELNATDDRGSLIPASDVPATPAPDLLPVLEGKQIEPFRAVLSSVRFFIRREEAERLLVAARTFGRSRLVYRDVAASTNRQTLIAAIAPRQTVTLHTLFCLKSELAERPQRFLCGVLNSFVADYLVRQRVTTHVSAAVIERLQVPVVPADSPWFAAVVSHADRLAAREDVEAAARLQAIMAALYGLTREELAHVVSTFPLVEGEIKGRTLAEFDRLATEACLAE
jgi:hypothetical protein